MCVRCFQDRKRPWFYVTSGQICEDPASWMIWVFVGSRLGFGFMPATCYWHWRVCKVSNDFYSLGRGEKTATLLKRSSNYSIYLGPLEITLIGNRPV